MMKSAREAARRLAPSLVLLAALLPASHASAEDGDTLVMGLEQVIEQALRNNLDIRTAMADTEQSDAGILASRSPFDPIGSIFYQHSKAESPTFNATQPSSRTSDIWTSSISQKLWYGASWEVQLNGNRSDVALPPAVQSTTPTYGVDAVVRYTQPLLEGLGRDANRSAVEKAINNAAVARDSLKIRARDTVKESTDAYWDLVFSVEDLAVKEAALELAQSLLRKNRIMVEVGTLAPLEVVQSEASVAERQKDIITGKAAVANAEDRLRGLMGVSERDSRWWRRIAPADKPEFHSAWVDLEDSLDTALAKRVELNSAGLQLENAKLDLAQAKDTRLPQLDFVLELSTDGLGGDGPRDLDGDGVPDIVVDESFSEAFSQVADRDFESWSASLRFTQPLFDRAAKADYTSKRLGVAKQEIAIERSRQTVILDVRRAVRDVETAREQITAARASRVLQEKKLDAEIKKFENGLSTNFEVLQFQTDLTTAESAELRSIVEHTKALVALKKARGELLSSGQAAAILP
jgi:outer membrane protein TolC